MLRAKPDLMPDIAPSIRSRIRVCGHLMRPLAVGALYWEDEDTLLVADLHLEKGAAFAALGMLLPPYDTRTTLQRLEKVINAVQPGRVVALGDSFHRSEGAAWMADDDLALLTRLQKGREWYWISGNHDPHLPASVGARSAPRLRFPASPSVTSRRRRSPSGRSPAIFTPWRGSLGAA